MTDYSTWLAFLASEIIDKCYKKLLEECPACKDGLLSPLLHLHVQYNLLDTMKKYFSVVSLQMDIQALFNTFIIKFGYYQVAEEEYIKTGQCFVRFSSAEAIYYGKYITKENDLALYGQPNYEVTSYQPLEETTKKPPKKAGRKKKVTGSGDS